MSIIAPSVDGAAVVPLSPLGRGHRTVRARARRGPFGGAWAEAGLYLPEWVPPDATACDDALSWQSYREPAGLGSGGTISTLAAALVAARPSPRGVRDAAGDFGLAPDHTIGREHDEAGAALGLRIEPRVTYERVNSLLAGAAAGVDGAGLAPTGWSITNQGGLTRTIVIDAVAGIPRIRIRYAGAPASNVQILVPMIPAATLAAAPGQAWTVGGLVAGSGAGLPSLSLGLWELDAGGAILRSSGVTPALPAAWTLRQKTATLGASTTHVRPLVSTGIIGAGTPCDFEIAIGGVTLTQTGYLPSFYPVGTAAVVRYADTVSMPWGAWGNTAAGTIRAVYRLPHLSAQGREICAIGSADGSAQLILRATTAGNNIACLRTAGGAEVGRVEAGAAVAGQREVLACSYGPAGVLISRNGGAPVANAALTPIGAPATYWIGRQHLAGSELNGLLESLSYRPAQLVGAELQALAA